MRETRRRRYTLERLLESPSREREGHRRRRKRVEEEAVKERRRQQLERERLAQRRKWRRLERKRHCCGVRFCRCHRTPAVGSSSACVSR